VGFEPAIQRTSEPQTARPLDRQLPADIQREPKIYMAFYNAPLRNFQQIEMEILITWEITFNIFSTTRQLFLDTKCLISEI
jgi:hypothetical protein